MRIFMTMRPYAKGSGSIRFCTISVIVSQNAQECKKAEMQVSLAPYAD